MLGFVNICHPDYADPAAVALGERASEALTSSGIPILKEEQPITDHKAALRAARRFIEADVDGVIVFYGAFVLCSTVMTLIMELNRPLLVWGVPMTVRDGILSTTGSYVSFSMFNGTLNRLKIQHTNLIAKPGSPEAMQKALDFAAAAQAVRQLRRTRIGLVGYTAMSIYPGTFDHVMMRYFIGPEIEHFDSYTLINKAEAVSDDECDAVLSRFDDRVRFPKDAPSLMKRRAAKLYTAIKELCVENDLQAITIKCQYEFSKEYGMTPCVPLSLLADDDIVTSCEGDVPCIVSSVMLHLLTGQTVSYGDAIHHCGNVLKLSPCGFMPFSLGNPGKQNVIVSSYPYFKGLLCSFVMHPGKVTVLRLAEEIGGYRLVYFTGTGLKSELRGGNMPSLDVELDGDIEKLIDAYPGQHFAICYGDVSKRIEMMADMMKIKAERI